MLKKIIILLILLFLNNCGAPGTAFLGPSVTVARTGNLYQAALSYGSGHVIKEAKKGIEKIQENKTIVYKQVDQINQMIKKDKLNKIALKKQSDLFFTTVKNNLKKNN